EHDGQRQELSLQDVNKYLYDPDRSVREAAARAWTKGLQDNARLLTFVFNTLVLDHQSDCTLRKFSDPAAPRNLDNEIAPEVVEALMAACERYHPTVQRYYRLKAQLLGLDQLYDYDRYAPLFAEQETCDWATARRTVEESYAAFSP